MAFSGATTLLGPESSGEITQAELLSGSSQVAPRSSGTLEVGPATFSGATTLLGPESEGGVNEPIPMAGASRAVPQSSGTLTVAVPAQFSGSTSLLGPESSGTAEVSPPDVHDGAGASRAVPASSGSMTVASILDFSGSSELDPQSSGTIDSIAAGVGESQVGPRSSGSLEVPPPPLHDGAGASQAAPRSSGIIVIGNALAGASQAAPRSSGILGVVGASGTGASQVGPRSAGSIPSSSPMAGASSVGPRSSGSITVGVGFYESTARELRRRYRTQFSDPRSIPSQHDNMPFRRPAESVWARVRVEFDFPPDPGSASGEAYSQFVSGILRVRINDPLSSGMQNLMVLADALVLPFTEETIPPGIHLTQPVVEPQGLVDSQQRVEVRCPFWAEQVIVR